MKSDRERQEAELLKRMQEGKRRRRRPEGSSRSSATAVTMDGKTQQDMTKVIAAVAGQASVADLAKAGDDEEEKQRMLLDKLNNMDADVKGKVLEQMKQLEMANQRLAGSLEAGRDAAENDFLKKLMAGKITAKSRLIDEALSQQKYVPVPWCTVVASWMLSVCGFSFFLFFFFRLFVL